MAGALAGVHHHLKVHNKSKTGTRHAIGLGAGGAFFRFIFSRIQVYDFLIYQVYLMFILYHHFHYAAYIS